MNRHPSHPVTDPFSSAADAAAAHDAIPAAFAARPSNRWPAPVWRADQLHHGGIRTQPSHHCRLDAQLPGGGWPVGMLTELITRHAGVGELRLLIPLLRQLTLERKIVILLAPPHIPYAPALASFGVDLDYLIVVQAPNAADRLWAVEQTLRSSSFGALLAWMPQSRTRPEHLRRMQLTAQRTNGPVFLFRELPSQFESSPAPLRLLLLPRPQQRLSVQILKRRGPLLLDPLLLSLPQPPASLPIQMPHDGARNHDEVSQPMTNAPANAPADGHGLTHTHARLDWTGLAMGHVSQSSH